MRLNEVAYGAQPPIDAYGNGGFRFAGRFHKGSMIVSPAAVRDWSVASMSTLTLQAFAGLLEERNALDVVLLGTGASIARPDAALIQAFDAVGLGLEFMDTGAACRTYNVLLAENRRVAAALIAVD